MCAITQAFKNCCGNRGERAAAKGAQQSIPLSWALKDEQAFLGPGRDGEAFRGKSMSQGTKVRDSGKRVSPGAGARAGWVGWLWTHLAKGV